MDLYCADCSRPLEVKKQGRVPKYCPFCRKKRQDKFKARTKEREEKHDDTPPAKDTTPEHITRTSPYNRSSSS